MEQRPQLSAALVRKGEAKPASPESVVGDDQGDVRAGAPPNLTVVQDQPAPVPRKAPPQPVGKPAGRRVVPSSTLSVRAPLDIIAGLAAVTYYTGEEKQTFVTRAIEEALNNWRPDWRSLIPEQG